MGEPLWGSQMNYKDKKTEQIAGGVILYNSQEWNRNAGIKGLLFDMDGLILDTEKLYTRFWQEAAIAFGYPMTREQALGMRSLNREYGEAKLRSYFGDGVNYEEVRLKRIELMSAFIEKEGVETKAGVQELMSYLKENDFKTAIATSSPLERAQKYLESVGLEDAFDKIITGDMVKKGKPEPEIYQLAAAKLGLEPCECLALEDSPTGIVSANKAGCFPVMIPDQDRPSEETKSLLFAQAECLNQVINLLKWFEVS